MSEQTIDLLGQILWFALFSTPLITVPIVWWFFKVRKVLRLLIGLLLACVLSLFLYQISLAILFRDGFGATLTTTYQDSISVNQDTTLVDGNSQTTISTDIEQLGKLLDFKTLKPVRVKYKYVFIDNSGRNERLSVSGPSDYSLQALLYFDSLTFEKFYEFDRHADYSSPNYDKSEFNFDWLDKDIRIELESSTSNYHGHPDFFFGSKGKSWYLDRKILLSKRVN